MSQMLIIGGGPAGITAALESARQGFSVKLVSDEKVGGRANWHSLLPSKVYLAAADYLVDHQKAHDFGLIGNITSLDLEQITKNIRTQAERWAQSISDQLREAGIEVINGRAVFTSHHELKIHPEEGEDETLKYDKAVIATGSVPIFPQRLKPDGKMILAPRFASKLSRIPERVIVVGGGVTGSEFAYLFNTFGAQVTWITDLDRLLPRMDKDLSGRLEEALASQGVEILKSSPVQAAVADLGGVVVTISGGKAVAANQAFVAVGRKADVDHLGLEAAGIHFDQNGILISEYCQTNHQDVYAVGDATGPPFIVNRGQAQAYIAAQHAAGVPTRPFRGELMVEAVYTNPQLAAVGISELRAAEIGVPTKIDTVEYPRVLKTRLGYTYPGFLKIISNPENGSIIGGAAIGPQAADLMFTITVAMQGNLNIDTMCSMFPAYPTYSELITTASWGSL